MMAIHRMPDSFSIAVVKSITGCVNHVVSERMTQIHQWVKESDKRLTSCKKYYIGRIML